MIELTVPAGTLTDRANVRRELAKALPELPTEAQVTAADDTVPQGKLSDRNNRPNARMGLSPGLGAHEWDFRADRGSKTSDPLVAMWKSSGRAQEVNAGRAEDRRLIETDALRVWVLIPEQAEGTPGRGRTGRGNVECGRARRGKVGRGQAGRGNVECGRARRRNAGRGQAGRGNVGRGRADRPLRRPGQAGQGCR